MNLSDKDLDRLFREASDRFEPDDSMLSWNRLEKNLAGKMPERPPGPPRRFGLRPMIWVPAAVLFAGLSLFLIKNPQVYRSTSTLPSSTPVTAVSPAPAAGAVSALTPAGKTGSADPGTARSAPPNTLRAGDEGGRAANSIDMNKADAVGPSGAAEMATGKTSTQPGAEENRSKLRRPLPAETNSGSGTGQNADGDQPAGDKLRNLQQQNQHTGHNKGRVNPEYPVRNNDLVTETTTRHLSRPGSPVENDGTASDKVRGTVGSNEAAVEDLGKDGNADAVTTTGRTVRPEFAATHLPGMRHSATPLVHDDAAALAKAAANKKDLPLPAGTVHVRQPLTIGLVMGPDYSDGGVTSNQLGSSVGLSVGYYLTKRLSVNTGLLYGVKSYSAKGRNFQPPPPPLRAFGSYPHFESANGTVTLFEIPLSLRYDFPIDSRTRLFLNAGVSSYLPIKETVTTFFHEQGRIYGLRQINNNPQAHWFAIGHYSGGIERDLGKGLSFQVEPYFNLPFTNVCTGNIRLNTYGLLLSIRFTPVVSRKKG